MAVVGVVRVDLLSAIGQPNFAATLTSGPRAQRKTDAAIKYPDDNHRSADAVAISDCQAVAASGPTSEPSSSNTRPCLPTTRNRLSTSTPTPSNPSSSHTTQPRAWS